MPWWISLVTELIKLFPIILQYIKDHNPSERKVAITGFKDTVTTLVKK